MSEYLKDPKVKQAAIRAGYSEATADSDSYLLMRDPEILAAIAEAEQMEKDVRQHTAEKVIEQYARIAFADSRSLTEYRHTACRHCWGFDNQYQRTSREMERDRERHAHEREEWELRDPTPTEMKRGGKKPFPPFDEKGGLGWDHRKDPNPDCEECEGEGRQRVVIHDTRSLDKNGAALFAGVKKTKDGVQILAHDQARAREVLAKNLGVLKDKLEVSGKLTLEALVLEACKTIDAAIVDMPPPVALDMPSPADLDSL